MSKKKRKPIRRKPQPIENREEQDGVILKPFLRMSPGFYLTVLYSLLVLFILFMLLFYKGLRDNGEYLRVQTFPPGASVRIDGQYVGSSPCEVLVKEGTHSVSVSKPHFDPVMFDDEFRSPLFGTLFVRPRRELDAVLELADPAALVRDGIQDFVSNPHIPEILMETVWAGRNSARASDDLYYFIDKTKYFTTNPLQLHSYLYAVAALESGIGALTPFSLLSIVDKIIQLNQRYENFPFWLAVVLQDDAAQRLVDTRWFQDLVSDYRGRYSQLRESAGAVQRSGSGESVFVQGIRFMGVPAGDLLLGDGKDGFASVQIPHPVSIPAFFMSEIEVTNEQFQRFVDENPGWAPSSKPALMRQGLVDEQYLASWTDTADQPGWDTLPVTNVSHHAAQAFCQWLTANLPAAYSNYSARLPFETEWEWAARGGLVGADYPTGRPSATDHFFTPDIQGPRPADGSARNGYGLQDMAGNVWEWCQDWYSPVKYLFSSLSAQNNDFDSSGEVPLGAEKVIRGGSWANEQELITVSIRGSQPPEWCTPYLGFRVILSRDIP